MDLFERISKSEGQSYQPSFNVDSKSKKSRLTSASDRSSNPQQQPQWSLVSSRVQSKTNKQRLTEQNNVRSSQETQLSLRSSGSSDVENTGAPGKFKVMFQMERKVAYKEDCNVIGKIITGMVVLFFVFFLIDFCYEWRHELDRKEIEVKQCSDDFVANHCIQPIDALVEECARLSFCASRQPGSLVKLTEVFCNTLVSLLGTTLSHMQIPGVLLLIGLIVAYLNRPTMYEQQKVRKYF